MTSPLWTLLWLLGAPAPEPMPAPPAPELPSYGGLLLRTVLALAIVLALAYVLLRWGLKRFAPGGRVGQALRVVARQPLDGRRSVVLVEAAGRYLLLGVGEGSVSLITELDRADVDRALAAADHVPRHRFADVLLAKMKRKEPPASEEQRDD